MGSDDLFKKRRESRKKRGFEQKQPHANSFLIVTEGECTEPFYFRGLKALIQKKTGGTIDVVGVPLIDVYGKGCSTKALLEKTDDIVRKAKVFYQNIWIVFDKDDFTDFDQAITEGRSRGYKIAWSNQSFEYWLYLHFEYSDSALHRQKWNEKLDAIFKRYNLGEGRYHKNYVNIYELTDAFGGVNTAIKHAKRRMSEYDEDKIKPSQFNPGTMVYALVEELREYLK